MAPSYLHPGDKTALVATAKKLERGQIDGAVELIQSWGLEVVEGKHLYASHNQWAGTDDQRLEDLQRALDDPEIKTVFFARGGYGTVRIIDRIHWGQFLRNPKWLCGFSDLTVLHSHVFANFKVETLHGSMPVFFSEGQQNLSSLSLKKALFGNVGTIEWGAQPLNRMGEAKGKLVGGNLSVLYSIGGSASEMDLTGKILFLEDLTEYLYHLDRMLWHFKRRGIFEKLAGLVVGQFTDMCDNPVPFGKTAEEVILEAVFEYSFPVAFNAPIGHVPDNHAVYHGRTCTLEVMGDKSVLAF